MKTKFTFILKKYFFLGIIILLATLLRLYDISSNPPHLTQDEAALGYNAYSILKTGRDEYGEILPIVFKSFGDYKPGLYVYLSVPSVALFGLNEFAVRFPSAVAGVFFVFLTYKLALVFGQKEKDKETLALITAFIAAVIPWNIYFSRGAWEANVALTLTMAGIYFFYKSLEKNTHLLYSAFFFGLSLITYQGAKLSTFIVVILLSFIYRKKLFLYNRKTLVTCLLVGMFLSFPIIESIIAGNAGRLKVFSVFSYSRPDGYLNYFLNEANTTKNSFVYYIFYSEQLNFFRGILGRWFNHFSGRFLFFEGDWQNLKHTAAYHGMLLLGSLPFLLTGFYVYFNNLSKERKFILLWLALAPLSAALSRDQVQAVRSLNTLAPLVFVIACGTFHWWKKSFFSKIVIVGISVASILYFLESYFVLTPHLYSKHWHYGYKQSIEYIDELEKDYDEIHFEQSYAQPYIFLLFYKQYDPASYQKVAHLEDGGYDVGLVTSFDKYVFAPIYISQDFSKSTARKLIIADPISLPDTEINSREHVHLLKEIYYLDGRQNAIRIVGVDKW